jgi:hypothetical protein
MLREKLVFLQLDGLPSIENESWSLQIFDDFSSLIIKRLLLFSLFLHLRRKFISIYLLFRGENEDIKKLLQDSAVANFYRFSECENLPEIPQTGFKIRRKKKIIKDIRRQLEESIDKNLLQSVRKSLIENLRVPDKVEYYSPVKTIFTPIVHLINRIEAQDLWIRLSFNPVSYDTSLEENYLSVKYRLLNDILDRNMRKFLKERGKIKADLDIFPSGILNEHRLQKAFFDIDHLLKSFTDEPKLFCNFHFLSTNKKESLDTAKFFIDTFFEDSFSVEVVDISTNSNLRLDNIFTFSEIKNLIQLPFESEHLKLQRQIAKAVPEKHFKLYTRYGDIYLKKENKYEIHNLEKVPIEEIFSKGGIFTYDHLGKERTIEIAEQILLRNIWNLLKQSNKVTVFHLDSSYEPYFNNLVFLKVHNVYSRISKAKTIKEKITHIEELIKDRIHQKFAGKYADIYEYNKNSFVKEKIIFVLLRSDELYKDDHDMPDLEEIIMAGEKAGVYFILYGDHTKLPQFKSLPQFMLVDNKEKLLLPVDFPETVAVSIDSSKNTEVLKQELKSFFESVQEEKDFLSIPIGVTPSGEEVRFSLGEYSDAYHAFIVGATRSGKTTLINNILFEIARKYSADEIRLILMDYKSGIEFNIFKYHPNVEELCLSSDLNLSLEILDRLVDEMDKRASLFKEAKVTKINEYNKQNPDKKIPYKILIVDEAQKLFQFEYSSEFSDRLEQIARLGGAFGIHFILISQTFREVRIKDTIKAQARLRIAFRLGSIQDAMEIFEIGNKSPLYLERYQCIYNNGFGVTDANILVYTRPPMFSKAKEAEEFLENLKETLRKQGRKVIDPMVYEDKKPQQKQLDNNGNLPPEGMNNDLLLNTIPINLDALKEAVEYENKKRLQEEEEKS